MSHLQVSNIASMQGLVALVTGGGTGIGLTIAKGYSANGAKVYITGRRANVLDEAAKEVSETLGLELVPLQMDVESKESIANAVAVISDKEGKLDVLVNNAGIPGSFYSLPDSKPTGKAFGEFHFSTETFEEWTSVFSTNAGGPFFVTMGFLGLLENGAQGRGGTSSVINISSPTAQSRLSLNTFKYGTSKAGLEHLTVVLATEFARRDIPVRVNALVPVYFVSQMVKDEEELNQRVKTPIPGSIATVPLLRAGKQEELVMSAVYLGSSGGGYSNGATLSVDGGWGLVNL